MALLLLSLFKVITMRLPQSILALWAILNLLVFRGESFVLSANLPPAWQRGQECASQQPQLVSSSSLLRNHERSLFAHRGGGTDEHDVEETRDIPKNHIAVSSNIDLPFSAEIAFDAFSDLPRQSSWSPWLKSVEYVKDGSSRETKWTMKSVLGVSYSWNAISTRLERPRVIEWESSKGLKNWGRVEFVHKDVNATTMRLTLTFVAPRIVARFFKNRDGGLSRVVKTRIVGRTLHNFRRVVLAEDVPEKEQETKKELAAALGPPQERYKSIAMDSMK